MGNPIDPAFDRLPLINQAAVDQMQASIGDALERGARLVTGGTVNGLVHEPTILADVPHDAICTSGGTETFGPLLVVEAYDEPTMSSRKPRTRRSG